MREGTFTIIWSLAECSLAATTPGNLASSWLLRLEVWLSTTGETLASREVREGCRGEAR